MNTRRAVPIEPRRSGRITGSCSEPVLENADQPAWFLPISGQLYFHKSQLPATKIPGQTEPFRTKCELAVEILREQARMTDGPHLGVFDGGYALGNVVRPLVVPDEGFRRIEFLTRLRHDARLHALPATKRPKGKRGADARLGQEAAATTPRRPMGRSVAGRFRFHLRANAEGPLERGGVSLAGPGA